ncbi:hypothetical protein D3C79_553610 [compost metagenome]
MIGKATAMVFRVKVFFQICHARGDQARVMVPVMAASVAICAPGPSLPLPMQRWACRLLSRFTVRADTHAAPSKLCPSTVMLPTFWFDMKGVVVGGVMVATVLVSPSA